MGWLKDSYARSVLLRELFLPFWCSGTQMRQRQERRSLINKLENANFKR